MDRYERYQSSLCKKAIERISQSVELFLKLTFFSLFRLHVRCMAYENKVKKRNYSKGNEAYVLMKPILTYIANIYAIKRNIYLVPQGLFNQVLVLSVKKANISAL